MKKILKRADNAKTAVIISAVIFICVYVLMILFMYLRLPYILDSDMASEMILGTILRDENRIMTDSWFYSTELRVINTQLVYSLFFRFTENWKTVRILSNAVLYLVLSGSTVYLCRKLRCGKYAFITAVFILLPVSSAYLLIVDTGCYYIPCIAAELIFAGLCFEYLDERKIRSYTAAAVSAVIAFAAGTGGLRQIVVSYFPFTAGVVLAMIIIFFREGISECRKSVWFRLFPFMILSTLAASAGYIVNEGILRSKYDYYRYENIRFTEFSVERFAQVFNDILGMLGYRTERINLLSVFSNFVCALIVLTTVYGVVCGLKKNTAAELKIMTVFFLGSLAVFFIIYSMTDMSYTARYTIPVIVLVYPLISCVFRYLKFGNAPEKTGKYMFLMLSVLLLGRGCLLMNDFRTLNRSGDLVEVAEYLKESDYETGYATFWNANILTELTDGKLDMYSWGVSEGDGSGMKNVQSPDDIFRWLQKKEHLTNQPSGRVFAVFKNPEIQYCVWADRLRDEDIIFSSDSYTVYGYENYEQMTEITGKYSEQP